MKNTSQVENQILILVLLNECFTLLAVSNNLTLLTGYKTSLHFFTQHYKSERFGAQLEKKFKMSSLHLNTVRQS